MIEIKTGIFKTDGKNENIYMIGDIHGDIKRFKEILIDSRVINENLEWIAEPSDTIIVQLGDQIDSLNRNTNENFDVSLCGI